MPYPQAKPLPPGRAVDVIRKHEAHAGGINLTDTSTTKKIVQKSVQSRIKMAMMDDVLN